MSDNNLPRRPEGLGNDAQRTGTTPRLEVEPTPSQDFAEGNAGAHSQAGQTQQVPNFDTAYQTHTQSNGAGPARPAEAQGGSQPNYQTERYTVVKTKTKKLPVFLASFLGLATGAVLVIALVMTGAFRITDSNVESADAAASSSSAITIDPEDTTLSEVVAAKALPSVVSITAQGENPNTGGIGSGVILDAKGNILTNNHVIENAATLAVSVDDGSSYEAEVVGADPSSDLAVIRLKDIKGVKLTPVELGDSDNLSVGEWVMAIGSPFGNEQSVSTGIVSALYRSTALPSTRGTSIYANMIQTDAAINPGNSGGALVNDEGKLIGINSVIESYSGSSSGVGFAIPVNYAINIAQQIIDGKTPAHPYLGVSLGSVNAVVAREHNLPVDSGAYVGEVTDDSPAGYAGIEDGDIVTAVDGDAIASADGLIIALREHKVGDTVTLTIVRGKLGGSKEMQIEVELGSDEALQEEQEDSTNNSDIGGITEEEFLRYLEELMGGSLR